MNWKLVIIGGIAFWLVTNIVGLFGTGMVIHEGILEPVYRAHESFWIPALNEDPPDMAAVMPRWLLMSLLSSVVVAGLYSCVHSAFKGPGWKRGMVWGLCLGIFSFVSLLGWSGVINLPMQIWIWWGIDGLILFLIGGAAMGWAGQRFAGA